MKHPSCAILHCCFCGSAGDASLATGFHSSDSSLVRNRRKKGKDKRISKSNFAIYYWKTAPRAINFDVASEGNSLTYPTKARKLDSTNSRSNEKKQVKSPKLQKLSKKAFEKLLDEVQRQDEKLLIVNINIEENIKELEKKVIRGITSIKIQG